ncbi:MAG: hypothetical protein Q8N51_18285 [Gammaproteobacteria bacterium]|nr:hypothetical protein [Gammaproteobacteria bacterium]
MAVSLPDFTPNLEIPDIHRVLEDFTPERLLALGKENRLALERLRALGTLAHESARSAEQQINRLLAETGRISSPHRASCLATLALCWLKIGDVPVANSIIKQSVCCDEGCGQLRCRSAILHKLLAAEIQLQAGSPAAARACFASAFESPAAAAPGLPSESLPVYYQPGPQAGLALLCESITERGQQILGWTTAGKADSEAGAHRLGVHLLYAGYPELARSYLDCCYERERWFLTTAREVDLLTHRAVATAATLSAFHAGLDIRAAREMEASCLKDTAPVVLPTLKHFHKLYSRAGERLTCARIRAACRNTRPGRGRPPQGSSRDFPYPYYE